MKEVELEIFFDDLNMEKQDVITKLLNFKSKDECRDIMDYDVFPIATIVLERYEED